MLIQAINQFNYNGEKQQIDLIFKNLIKTGHVKGLRSLKQNNDLKDEGFFSLSIISCRGLLVKSPGVKGLTDRMVTLRRLSLKSPSQFSQLPHLYSQCGGLCPIALCLRVAI